MGRLTLERAALAIPTRRRDGVPSMGADEDPFTLGVEALEALAQGAEPTTEIRHLKVIGNAGPATEELFRAALGAPTLAVEYLPPGPEGVLGTLGGGQGSRERDAGPSATLVLDSARGATSAGAEKAGDAAVALRFGDGLGLEVELIGRQEGPMDDAEVLQGVVTRTFGGAAGSAPTGWLVVAKDRPDRLLRALSTASTPVSAIWRRSGVTGLGEAPGVSTLGALAEMSRSLGREQSGLLLIEGPSEVFIAAVRSTGPCTWIGPWDGASDSGMTDSASALPDTQDLLVVSQGAYIPRATYLAGVSSHWRMMADRCPSCRRLTFPRRGSCRWCGAREGLVRERLPRTGLRVEAVTTVSSGGQPTEFDAQVSSGTPYDVVIANVRDGVRITVQVTDYPPGTVRVGDRVSLRLRRLYPMEGEWRYGLKAVPEAR